MEFKVEAYNVDDENGVGHQEDQEDYANSEDLAGVRNNEAQSYVATYRVPVEVSGIIYNFEVIGTDDYFAYNIKMETGGIAFLCSAVRRNRVTATGTVVHLSAIHWTGI